MPCSRWSRNRPAPPCSSTGINSARHRCWRASRSASGSTRCSSPWARIIAIGKRSSSSTRRSRIAPAIGGSRCTGTISSSGRGRRRRAIPTAPFRPTPVPTRGTRITPKPTTGSRGSIWTRRTITMRRSASSRASFHCPRTSSSSTNSSPWPSPISDTRTTRRGTAS